MRVLTYGHRIPVPRVCPLCAAPVRLCDRDEVQPGYRPGTWVYVCTAFPACEAMANTQPGTIMPASIMADGWTRALRHRCHGALDELLGRRNKAKPLSAHQRRKAGRHRGPREAVYRWLARELGLTRDECHFGLFDRAQCERALALLQARIEEEGKCFG